MGNAGSSVANGYRRSGSRRSHTSSPHRQHPPPPPTPTQTQVSNHYVFAAETPYPPQYSNPNGPGGYYPYAHAPGYYSPPLPDMPISLPAPYDHHHHRVPHVDHPGWAAGGRYSYRPVMVPPQLQPPYVEHQKAVTVRNDVNLKKETLRIEPDEENPGKFLVAFTFDATVAGSITVIFFAREGEVDEALTSSSKLTPMKENLLPPVTIQFQQGLGQRFRQPSGTGIDFSIFQESELLMKKVGDIYPLVIEAEAIPSDEVRSDGTPFTGSTNSQITQAVFDKEKGEYHVKVIKQILWVNGMRYELQEIYGIGNSVEGDTDNNDPGKECVICLSEPRDTTVLPCRHMCMCSGCAKVLRFQTNRCPICRQPVERLLEIKVSKESEG